MKGARPCAYCAGAINLPHRTDADCFRALDLEIRAAQLHLRSLTKRKSHLLRLRIQHRQRLVAASRRRRR